MLDAQIKAKEEELSSVREELIEAHHRVADAYKRDSDRYGRLLDKQEEILDSRLGLNQPTPRPSEPGPKSIPRRADFGSVRAQFEKQQREDHWKKVIHETEKRDAERAKATPKAASRTSERTEQAAVKSSSGEQ